MTDLEIVLLVTVLDECFTAHVDIWPHDCAQAEMGMSLFIILSFCILGVLAYMEAR